MEARHGEPLDLGSDALSGLHFAHTQAGLLLDAMTRAIHRSNTTMSATSSANTTPQKYERDNAQQDAYSMHGAQDGSVKKLVRKFDSQGTLFGSSTKDEGSYLQYHQSRSPFGRRRDAADEREALLAIRTKLELLQQKLEDFLLFFSNQSAGPQSSSADPHGRTHLGEIDQARDELLWLALRKVDVVVRERTVLEAVIGFTRTGAIELEDGLEDLEHPIDTRVDEEREREREDVVSLIHGASSLIWREKTQEDAAAAAAAAGADYNQSLPDLGEDLGETKAEAATSADVDYNTLSRSPRRRIEWPETNQQRQQTKQPQQRTSPVSVLDAENIFQEKLQIDGAVPPSSVCAVPQWSRSHGRIDPNSSPIHPSKLSSDPFAREKVLKLQEGGEISEEMSEAGDGAEDGSEKRGKGRARGPGGLLLLPVKLCTGLCAGLFRIGFKAALIVAIGSTAVTMGSERSAQFSQFARAKARYVHSRALVPTSRVLADLGRRAKEVARERRVRRLEHQKQRRLAAARKIAELPVMTVTERDLGATTTTNAYANSSGATAMMTHTTVSFPDLAVASGRG